MKLAFNGEAHYTDFSEGYQLYVKRSKKGKSFDSKAYNRVIRMYCNLLAERLCERGMVDLPAGMGSITAAIITKRPQYRGKKFIGYGAMDWEKGHYDGKLKAFGLVFFPKRNKNGNLRCFGYVANRRLFKKMKEIYKSDDCLWHPLDFNNEMI